LVLLGPGDSCQTRFKSGNVCGFALPITSGARDFNEKVGKHSTPPVSGSVSGDYSWTTTPAEYARSQEFLFASGALYFHMLSGYAALVAPLCSDGPSATVHRPCRDTQEPA
jgi:hypothetical protein